MEIALNHRQLRLHHNLCHHCPCYQAFVIIHLVKELRERSTLRETFDERKKNQGRKTHVRIIAPISEPLLNKSDSVLLLEITI